MRNMIGVARTLEFCDGCIMALYLLFLLANLVLEGLNKCDELILLEEALLAVFFHELTVFIQFWDFVKKYLTILFSLAINFDSSRFANRIFQFHFHFHFIFIFTYFHFHFHFIFIFTHFHFLIFIFTKVKMKNVIFT